MLNSKIIYLFTALIFLGTTASTGENPQDIWCITKASIPYVVRKAVQNGETEQDIIEEMTKEYYKSETDNLPHYVFVDTIRVVREYFRHTHLTFEEKVQKVYTDCQHYGF